MNGDVKQVTNQNENNENGDVIVIKEDTPKIIGPLVITQPIPTIDYGMIKARQEKIHEKQSNSGCVDHDGGFYVVWYYDCFTGLFNVMADLLTCMCLATCCEDACYCDDDCCIDMCYGDCGDCGGDCEDYEYDCD